MSSAFIDLAVKDKWGARVCALLAITSYGIPVKGVDSLEGSAKEVVECLYGTAEPSSDEIAAVVKELLTAGEKHRKYHGEEKKGQPTEWTKARTTTRK